MHAFPDFSVSYEFLKQHEFVFQYSFIQTLLNKFTDVNETDYSIVTFIGRLLYILDSSCTSDGLWLGSCFQRNLALSDLWRWTLLLLTNLKITILLYLFVSSPKTMDFSKRYFFSIGSIQTHTRRNFQKPLNWNCNRSNMKVWCEQYPVDCPQTHIQTQSPIPPPCIEVCDPIRSSWLQFHSFRSVKLKTSLCALCFSIGVCMHQYNRCIYSYAIKYLINHVRFMLSNFILWLWMDW